ncbi:PIN domain-containing protein [Amycolatopsis alkalitolerans]|uniref:PIN domain-containing protein n=1 Tax=Amycolatopsis alkalitolerans TaxID=2547244 RepID=A0A5C4LPY1_9PSEU|nr:hypothetical protein [Amycolatopsis alkalitolerans]TNC19410.1 hypothetical protein FG385_32230 [Amycolatopsis alkalitolerans]
MVDPVTLWFLSSVAAPDAYTRIVNKMRSRSSVDKLRTDVRADTGLRTRRGYRKWLTSENTWDLLVSRNDNSYDELVRTLANAEARKLFGRRRDLDLERAGKLVRATIAQFLPTLDPSMATAIADFRSEERHSEVMAVLRADSTFDDSLTLLPQAVRGLLLDPAMPRRVAETIAAIFAQGEPRDLVKDFANSPPGWLIDGPPLARLTFAEIASSYGLHDIASSYFERVADDGRDRAKLYARAAYESVHAGDDSNRIDALLSRARAAEGDQLYRKVIEAAIRENWQIIVDADRQQISADALMVLLLALALENTNNLDDAIELLEAGTTNHPDSAGIILLRARLILARSKRPGTISRPQDVSSALKLARQARDLRRSWRGSSSSAVALACDAAFLSNDFDLVIRQGTLEPEGEAMLEEAADPDVLFSVAQAAMATGKHEIARRSAESSLGFSKKLILAELAAASNANEVEVNEAFNEAWLEASTENEKTTFWLSAAHAGVEPIPGERELAQRTDDIPLLATAAVHIARGRTAEAITILRPNRESESARRLLVSAYLARDRIDDAVDELEDLANRFDNTNHRVSAVQILLRADRLGDAAKIADRALRTIPESWPERDFCHEVGIAWENKRKSWKEMEARARSWINESGSDDYKVWLLVNALYNQAKSDIAWQVLQQSGDPEPDQTRSREVVLWIALHSEHGSTRKNLSRALRYAEADPAMRDIRAVAVNFYLMAGAKDSSVVTVDEVSRWQRLISLRAADSDPSDSFEIIEIPDDTTALIATFRNLLEPRAELVRTWHENVKQGWPVGMLAAVSGKTYAYVLAARLAGFTPSNHADRDANERELQFAESAIDGAVNIDISALATAWHLRDAWPQLVGAFTRILTTEDSQLDLARAVDQGTPQASGTLGWEVNAGRPTFEELNEEELDRLGQKLAWMRDTANTFAVADVARRMGDDGVPRDVEPWMSVLQSAKQNGNALWADDVGLRTLAQNEGVPSFSTLSLLRALCVRAVIPLPVVTQVTEVLRNECHVDFPLDESWISRTVASEGWRSEAVILTFSRATTWADLAATFPVWRRLVSELAVSDSEALPMWVWAAGTGIVAAVNRVRCPELLAGVLVTAVLASSLDPDIFSACAAACRQVATAASLAAPTELAAAHLFDLLKQRVGPAAAATTLARVGARLTGDDREALRNVVFGLKEEKR